MNLTAAISRLDRLVKVPEVNIAALESILYSCSTLKALIAVLPEDDSDYLCREMASRKLDWSNLLEITTLGLIKDICKTERISKRHRHPPPPDSIEPILVKE